MLGHHAGDLAEGVLKRVCEGGSLLSLRGMQERSSYQGMTLYRPLLSFPKQAMIRWLEERSLSFFNDPTNQSPSFLRSRMRQEILPFLTQSFGKEIASNLCRLGEEAGEVSAYFDALNAPLLLQIDQDRLDLTPHLPLPRLQVEFLLRRWLQREGITLSRAQLKGAVEVALSPSRSAQFCTRLGGFEIKKGVVCLIRSSNLQAIN
jgi:tRNA(Ile)-lysidine synthase